jgi:NAD+ diphosphatase
MTTANNFYAGGGLDRAAHLRDRPDWLEAALARPMTRLVPVWQSRNLIAEVTASPTAALIHAAEAAHLLAGARAVAMLGYLDEIAHLAVDLSHLAEAEAQAHASAWGEWLDLRRVGPVIDRRHGSLLAYARGLMHWHSRHGFCGVCGSPTAIASAGHVRKCTNSGCGASHFPRTDPAVIMLVHDGDKALLGRQKVWAKGMYSTLAGFVEPGESLEETVRREVFEETGIAVGDVVYHSSQPWPFPASLMIGFHAVALSRRIDRVDGELEDAAWFSRAELRSFADRGKNLPRQDSIARRLVEDWLARG